MPTFGTATKVDIIKNHETFGFEDYKSHVMLTSAAEEAEGIKGETLEDMLVKTAERLASLKTCAI